MTTVTTQTALETTGALPLAEASQPGRLLSLDVFRGLTVAAMILVNNPGDWGHIYAPLEHAEWHGCTPTDLIFPFFLFIVGVSITYALGSAKRATARHAALLGRVARRAAVLFGLGLLMALQPKFDFAHVRIMGVLPRIALVFLVCGTVFVKTGWRTQLGLLATLLIGYNVLLQLVPVPGFGLPNLEPATNLGAWLDRTVLGENHLWVQSKTWDPEGLLSTLPAIGTGLLGLLAGQWLRRPQPETASRVVWLLLASGAASMLGLVWNLWLPINKSLWTSSYVLYTGGLAGAALAALYWLCDVQGWRGWLTRFGRVYGVNAITVFFLSGVIARWLNMLQVPTESGEVPAKTWLYERFFTPFFSPVNASLAGALACVLIWYAVLWLMHRRNIIVKV
ncbi:acyltransferase family protein [Hymenobacter rubripertinctus]|uniref:DUF1624 domain-containing protein n=1 Tax=Hymenobacter rubripertinctus TaxID=2029981 RepID=A0A418QSJ3_9BACT|nr:heparan-alpha-glucosaminide N-acetyltransferase domain-containing protein [Hymenobacter rubripertinctus]RIY08196.1 DUF1624 domain-containing protein [Hymenobacter rubripertinctus]